MSKSESSPAQSSPWKSGTKSGEAVQAYIREWSRKTRERITQGEPFVSAGLFTPHEIFEAMEIPWVLWGGDDLYYPGLIDKKEYHYYKDLAAKEKIEKGYDRFGRCGHCNTNLPQIRSLPGLSALVIGESGCCSGAEKNSRLQITGYRSRGWNVPVFRLEDVSPAPYYPHYPHWWEKIEDHWDQVIEPYKLDYRVEELKALIKFLEFTTGKTFSMTRLAEVMELVNEQDMWLRKTRDLVAKTVPCPAGVSDHMAVYPAQFHRGTVEARDLAKMFYEEVKDRVDQGEAACPNEKFRLQWLKSGFYGNPAFYEYFEKNYGAIFVASLYLSLASEGYPRSLLNDPLRALAGRHLFLGLYHGPQWDIKEAHLHQADAAIMGELMPCQRVTHSNQMIYKQAYEAAGIPLCVISTTWDADKIKAEVSQFIETRLLS